MQRWSGRVALVTGASSGIGVAIVKELVQNGLKVVAVARRVELIQEYKKELTGAKGELHSLKVDLRQEDDIVKAFEWVEKHLGGIDVLINNAGVADPCSIIDTPTETWKKIMDTNFMASAICSREAIKTMRKKANDHGIIININSIAGHIVFPTVEMYCCAKIALTAMSKALQKELMSAGTGIRVTNLSPGFVLTDMTSPLFVGKPEIAKQILVPKDIADCVMFLLSMNNNVLIKELSVMPKCKEVSLDQV